MDIIPFTRAHIDSAAPLAADFRVTLKSFKGITARPNIDAAREELMEYLDSSFPCFLAVENDSALGYLVCRVNEPCVWVESIYVRPECRRGVATALFRQAEALAASLGEETVFNYVHPSNDRMIAFLRRQGYTVLNLIEIRRPYAGEHLSETISVGAHEFDY